jgi:predicted nucleotide-binding protein
MKRETDFNETLFPAHVIREAAETLFAKKDFEKIGNHLLVLQIGKEKWTYDSFEQFLSNYQNQTGHAWLSLSENEKQLRVNYSKRDTGVEVKALTNGEINMASAVFERAADASKLPPLPQEPKPTLTVFIGHGRNPLWRDLKDHLVEKHGYNVEAYEVGARAGHTIRDILEDMLEKSSFACLVLTAEDEMADGKMHARQNVIHETGLFQGRLGFSRAIVLLEDGAEEFSNIHGVQQIRFSKDKIKETFGEVLATLRREFFEQDDS